MGALTIKPLAFKTRSWELSYTNYPNFFDNNFGLVTIQKRGNEIMRILPSRHDTYFWITNKTRFFFETLKIKRLTFPFFKYNTEIVKIKWKKIIKFLQYLRVIQNLSKRFLPIPKFFKNYKFGNFTYYNNTYSSLDFISNFLFKKFFNFNNTLINYSNNNAYIGNLADNYLSLQELKLNKINIFNNLNIVTDFPRIWTVLKNNHLNYYIGIKKYASIFVLQISNKYANLYNREILFLLKNKIQIYTEEKLKINFSQIILKNNYQLYTNLWFDNIINYGILNKDNLYLHFNTNNNSISNNGIHFNFQDFGNMPKSKYSFFLPISTLLEEKKTLLDGYGNLQSLNIVMSRKLQVRSLIQLCWVFTLILNIYKKRNYRYKKFIKTIHLKNFTLLENLILLFFGRIDLTLKKNNDFMSNILSKKIPNIIITPQLSQISRYETLIKYNNY